MKIMRGSRHTTIRKPAMPFFLGMAAAVAGTLLAHGFGATLKTSPPWLGPAIVIGAFTILVGGLLLLPTLVRARRAARQGPRL